MSVHSALYDILKSAGGVTALVGGTKSPRIYPLGIPQGKTGAAVVYQTISAPDDVTCTGHKGQPDATVQITCWSAQGGTPDDAQALADAVYAALTAETANGSHGGTDVHYWTCLDDARDIVDANEQNEALTRYGIQSDWEVSYTR